MYFHIESESMVGRLKNRCKSTFLSIKMCKQFCLKSK